MTSPPNPAAALWATLKQRPTLFPGIARKAHLWQVGHSDN